MKINQSCITSFEITDVKALDPIRVYIEDYEPGKGRITISCYASAWVGYWGGMGSRSVIKFFLDCDAEYLSGNLLAGDNQKRGKSNEAYLIRIIKAVQDAFREVAA